MSASPLLHVSTPEHCVAWHRGRPITAARFLADVRQLGERLLPGSRVLNVCADRYLFAVGFAAALLTGRSTLLPSSIAPLAIDRLRQAKVEREAYVGPWLPEPFVNHGSA